ncbi:MAG: glycoside hydrolase family 38 C-terminal domain-containing protein [Bacillota bacterium]
MDQTVKSSIKFLAKCYLLTDFHKLMKHCYKKVADVDVTFSESPEPTSFEDRLSAQYAPIKKGQVWSTRNFDCGWFHIKGQVPASCAGKKVVLVFSINGEGVLMDSAGNPLQGISDLSAVVEFAQPKRGKRVIDIAASATGEEVIDYWLEAGNNRRPNRPVKAKLKEANIAIVDDNCKALFYDFVALAFQATAEKVDSQKAKSITVALKASLKKVKNYTAEEIAEARAILAKEMDNGEVSPYTVYATGHAHLDLAYLWPIRETKRKAGRTFANQLHNISKYDDYVFGASQPQQFEWMEERYPALFARMKEAIESGNMELQGGMWVETDTNVVSGESMVRQNLYGKRYWKEKFNKEMRMCWLPDVFGFSGNLPQILKKCGMDYFETIKLSWNNQNKFPHRTFIWEGIDNSDVIVSMPPDETYSSDGSPWSMVNAIKNFPEKDKVDVCGMLFGVGDGGGGPGEGHLEMLKRVDKMKGLPAVKLAPAIDLFDELAKKKDVLVRHKGELYLEKHQGTYTTQSKNKYYNRKCEFALQNLEFFSVVDMLKGAGYPQEDIERIWKEVLLYQFHDIIPGSSIKRVYDESQARYAELLEELIGMQKVALRSIASGNNGKSIINPIGYPVKGVVAIEDKVYAVDLAPFSASPIGDAIEVDTSELKGSSDSIESDKYFIKFGSDGSIVSLFDKVNNKEISGSYMNQLSVYNDKKLKYNAWDIDIEYSKQTPNKFVLLECENMVTATSIVRKSTYKYNLSTLVQTVTLSVGKPIIEFTMNINWQETHKMLRADFKPTVFNDEVTCDIQFGSLKRSTKDDTKIEKAQFEICAHKWIDVTEEGYGLSVITESKYGWRVKEGLISLNLLRSPVFPAPDADKGKHTLKYALYPHTGDYNEAETQRVAYTYNNAPILVDGAIELDSVANSSNVHAVIDGIKIAEDGSGIVIRMYEDAGCDSVTKLAVNIPYATVVETNLLEETIKEINLADEISFTPYEIKTFILKK